jgi:SAM-dependent methyltransferase
MSGMKSTIIKLLAPYQYPQIVFSKAILDALGKAGVRSGKILDCPCGNGEVSYHLSCLPDTHVKGVDIDAASIITATRNFKKGNLEFNTGDIFEELSRPVSYDAICVVNSLFLLPDHEKLFSLLRSRLRNNTSRLLIITPNTEGDNFKNFQLKNPSINKSILNKTELKTKATENGFTMTEALEIAYITHYNRKELKYFSVFSPFYLLMLNYFKNLSKRRHGNYILYSFTKNL